MRNNGGVYVAQNGLIGRDGVDSNGRPRYSVNATHHELAEGQDSLSVDLTLVTDDNVQITKRFTFHADDYLIDIDYIINNQSESQWRGNLFGQIKRDGARDPSSAGGFGMSSYLGAVLTTDDDPYKKVDFGDIDRSPTSDVVQGGWIGFSQHYFLGAWIPGADQTHTYTTRRNSAGEYLMGFVSPETLVPPGSSQTLTASLWAGPKDQYRLGEIAPRLNLTIDYGWLWFIAQPIFWLLTQINDVIGNFGWSIIAMTIVIKLLFFWLSSKSYRSMAKMRRLTPKIQQLKDRFGEDKQKLMQAQMDLWRKEKVNPMGGCLPMLLQMPVLIGIYWVLMESVELRHADWILWYHDLSAMDPYFILPLVMGASMYVSQLMTPMATMDPMQAKMMRLMPLFFTVFFLWFPAGLVLYWLVSQVFNIVHQWYINKSVDAAYAKQAARAG
jgi:YidC/Oxa1 family membrane protein insertase